MSDFEFIEYDFKKFDDFKKVMDGFGWCYTDACREIFHRGLKELLADLEVTE